MTSKMPPVPPGNRSPKGSGDATAPSRDTAPNKSMPENIEQQGDHANISQNTTNQDHQQDR